MNASMKAARAVLLAAGQGKRMKSSKPKVLHDVLGKPILRRIIDAVEALEIEHVHIVVGHEAGQIEQYLSKNPPSVPYSLHLQEPQLGTGDALRKVVPSLSEFQGTLLVSVADTPLLRAETLAPLLEGHRREGAKVTLLTTMVDDAKSYGRIIRDAKGRVTAIVEDKDATDEQKKINEINPAIYCFQWPDVQEGLDSLQNNNRQKEYYLTDLIGWAHNKGITASAVVAPDWREVAGINSRMELAEGNRLLRDIAVARLAAEGVSFMDPSAVWIAPEVSIGQDSTVLPGCVLTGEIKIGSGCTIGPNTTIKGPVTIGDESIVMHSYVTDSQIGSRCQIGPFAHMRNGNVVSDAVRIGNFVEIKNAAISDHSNVSHLSYVGDAEIGSRSNIGAGTITANYDHITKKKERTVIGDDVATGSNSVLVAPVKLDDGSVVGAGTVVTKDVPAGALAVGRAPQSVREGWAENKRKKAQGR